MAGIDLQNIMVKFGKNLALRSISGQVKEGSLIALVGPNGGGKTTLLRVIQGQLKPNRGKVVNHFPKMAYMPQKSQLDAQFPIPVGDVVAMGMWHQKGFFSSFTKKDQDKIKESLQEVGLKGYENEMIHALSGGQFQRVLFARLIIQDAPFIILDEPFSAVDVRTYETLMKLILKWHQAGKTIIVVIHNFEVVEKYFPETILLAREIIHWGETKTALNEKNLAEAFRQVMV